MYFNTQFNLSKWDPDAEYAVFDDFDDWSRFYQYKAFLGAQEEFELTGKYLRVRTVRWGKPSIVLSNTIPIFQDQKWIEANCFIINLRNKKLF